MTEERIHGGSNLSADVLRLIRSNADAGMILSGASRTTRGTFVRRNSVGRALASALRSKCFSIASINSTTLQVTVRGGRVVGFSGSVAVAQTVVSVGGTEDNPHYVYAEGTISPLTGRIYATSTATFPVHDAQKWRRCLFSVYVDSTGGVHIPAGGVYHDGLIDLKTWYGP